jgi:hypothetical protein
MIGFFILVICIFIILLEQQSGTIAAMSVPVGISVCKTNFLPLTGRQVDSSIGNYC